MGLVFEVNTDQELREKMESGYIIAEIREYFEEQKAEGELPFATEQLTRANAIDFVEVSSYETSIDYQTYVNPDNRKLVEDFWELVRLAYDQVFSPEPEVPEPESEELGSEAAGFSGDYVLNWMFQHFKDDMERLVDEAVSSVCGKRFFHQEIRYKYGRICGALSYLFLSGGLERDEYQRLQEQVRGIYDFARDCLGEVR